MEDIEVPESAQTITDPHARRWALFCHICGLAWFIPFANLVFPFTLWLMKRNDHPFIDDQGKEAVNFQISMVGYVIVAGILSAFFIGFIFLAILSLAALVLPIIAAVKAHDGQRYRYPFTIRLID